ncbi:MAG: aldo/keto reductase [Planctomycetaceae bacterium]|nr:aldo/keto reductase [Planctomycetaceae bacterium]MBQ2820213.1 aldo/keto reductase [Thermoguttaceae bacterium]
MEKRIFKSTNDEISLLGFGTMRLPMTDPETMEINYPKAEEMIDFAWENGVNYFDTAYGYHNGLSETFIGHALSKYPRESFRLASKMPSWMVQTPEDVARIFNDQLRKCQVEYFDYYLVHNITENKLDRIEDLKMHEFLTEMKREGKIRHLGFSFHDCPEVLKRTIDRWEWEFAQIQLNYLDWEMQDAAGQYQLLTEAGLPVIVMEPLRGGSLVSLSPEALEIQCRANPYLSPAAWGLRFAASLSNVLTVLSGMSSLEQVRDNVKTMSNFQPLTETELNVLPEILTAYRKAAPIPCTACRYCQDCPKGVDIPRVLAAMNHFHASKSSFSFLQHANVLGPDKQPEHCVGCGKCEKVCPQKIQIPQLMKEAAEMIRTFERPDWLQL